MLEFLVDEPERVEPSYHDREHGNSATVVQGREGKVSHLLLNRLMLHDCWCCFLLVQVWMRRVVPIPVFAFHNKNLVQVASQVAVELVSRPLCPSNSFYSGVPWLRYCHRIGPGSQSAVVGPADRTGSESFDSAERMRENRWVRRSRNAGFPLWQWIPTL